ncbi:MAG: phosphoglycerate kinase [Bacteroidota bacterium]|nr:phosphoglycerate kinase [Bacteroidota bacterium]
MKTIDNYNFKGKKALTRVDFNVPIENGIVGDDTRIRAALPTIKKILSDGGSVILMSHLGRPKGKESKELTLKPIAKYLGEKLNLNVKFSFDSVGNDAKEKASNLLPGEVLVLENLRFHPEEESGNLDFAEKLSQLADVYVNDAFGTAHRAHASTTVVAGFFPADKVVGYLMAMELKSIEKVLSDTKRPFTAIVGGAKVSDKVGIIENLLEKADNILIGGAMAYTFLKARNENVGKSRVEEDKLGLARELMTKADQKNVKIFLPEDSIIVENFKADAPSQIAKSGSIPEGWMGLDIGPAAREIYSQVIENSKTVLWNGPMGVFEWEKFAGGTKAIAEAVKEATSTGAFTLVGGGDSVAAVQQMGFANNVSYISTGGGAMLEALEGTILPGVEALMENGAIKR